MVDYTRLSKTVSHALRHAPEQYGLTLDAEGWTSVDDLLAGLKRHSRRYHGVTQRDLDIALDRATKKRWEIQDGRIRAFYGHSTADRVQKTPTCPPDILYHGTAPQIVPVILDEGLRAMSRQYVHLSADEATARMVGSRHAAQPVILRIKAREAYDAGIGFYHGNEDVWLADTIPPDFIAQSSSNT